jgi:NAD(P)-dependent dehydrogenase (short-subunit alcohol dehydrogenase family)
MSEVVVVIGPGSIGQAIARRVSAGKHVVLADLLQANADAAADAMRNAGFDISTTTVDVSSRDSVHALVEAATAHGDVTALVHAAGSHQVRHSPKPSSPSTCTEPRSCSSSSATSSPPAAPASSSHRSPGTASAPSPRSRTPS